MRAVRRCSHLRGRIEEAVDGVRHFGGSVLDVLLGVLGKEYVGVLLVKAVVFWTDVLLVVPFQTFSQFNICENKKKLKVMPRI